MQELLKHYERRGVIVRAMIWGTLIGFIGFGLDAVAHHFNVHWMRERVVVNAVEGLFFAALVSVFIRARERRLAQRFTELGYLNHHIRNCLTIIWYSEHVCERKARYDMIHDACNRIQTCLEKVSRREDCSINHKDPREL